MRLQLVWTLVLTLTAHLTDPACALLDSGESIGAETPVIRPATGSQTRQSRVVATNADIDSHANSLVVPNTAQSGISSGCRRSTDFLEQVCSNPDAASSPTVTADLLICDLPDVEPLIRPDSVAEPHHKPPSTKYAVSGTIVVQGDRTKTGHWTDQLPALDGSTPSGTTQQADPAKQPGVPNGAAYPGPNDEGFWRQRDGSSEWHPASDKSTEQQSHEGDPSAGSIRVSPDAQVQPSDQSSSSHVSLYDAWSAEQEQGAFLSFNEWKERHAPDLSNPAKDNRRNPKRDETQDVDVKAPSANSDPIASSQNIKDSGASPSYQNEAATSRGSPSPSASSEMDSVPPTSSQPHSPSDQAQASEADLLDSQNQHPGRDRSEPSIKMQADSPKVGFSVSAGDTSTQLQKLKHRWNFASLDCAAVVHRTNPEAKFASAILSEKKDRYMLSPCPQSGGRKQGSSQFVIVELCEEIKIDTLVLANYEFFSNMFKKFKVTAAKQLTGRADDWTELGVFRARNVRGQQVFRIPYTPRSDDFFKYVRIDFLEHFGSEFYCPVSLLRVYGITEMEEYKQQVEGRTGDPDPVDEVDATPSIVEDVVVQTPSDLNDAVPLPDPLVADLSPVIDTANLTAKDEDIWRKHEQAFQRRLQNQTLAQEAVDAELPEGGPPMGDSSSSQPPTQPSKAAGQTNTAALGNDTTTQDRRQCFIEDAPSHHANSTGNCVRPRSQTKPFYVLESELHRSQLDKKDSHQGNSAAKARGDTNARVGGSKSGSLPTEAEADAERARRASVPRTSGNPSGPHGSPGSESVYRAIHRRLSALEANATLSLSYIEHSGQMLREVFARMEKRQELRMSDMLRALNTSNWQQIESLKRRQQVDLQRAIFEFDVHRQQADNERRALLREVHILAEEVLLEKRLSIAQLIMLLVVLVFVGMTRGSRTAPLLHSGFAKIGRGSRRREAKADGKLILPASPMREAARMESSTETHQPQRSPLRESMSIPARKEPQRDHIAVLPSTQQMIPDANVSTPARSQRPVLVNGRSSYAGEGPHPAARLHPKTSTKVPGPSLVGRNQRGESLVGMLSHPRTRARLVLLLDTLDALDRAQTRNPSRVSASRSVLTHKKKSGVKGIAPATATNVDYGSVASPSSPMVRRASRTHRPAVGLKQENDYVGNRRQATLRDRKKGAGPSDDLAGMSSDWTERSENGEVSESAAFLSDEDKSRVVTSPPELFSVEPMMRASTDPQTKTVQPRPMPSDSVRRFVPGHSNIPHDTDQMFKSVDSPDGTPQIGTYQHATGHELPSIARTDGRLSSSDSESEGGAWHRVLPRRIGHSSSVRRARQGVNEAKLQRADGSSKNGSRTDLSDRRGSPRPSSSQSAGSKSQKPMFSKLFRPKSPEDAASETPRNLRSGTPGTIRDVTPS